MYDESLINLQASYTSLQLKYKIQTDRLVHLSDDYSISCFSHDSLQGELARQKTENDYNICQLKLLLEEALCALMSEKSANDLLEEEEGKYVLHISNLEVLFFLCLLIFYCYII